MIIGSFKLTSFTLLIYFTFKAEEILENQYPEYKMV